MTSPVMPNTPMPPPPRPAVAPPPAAAPPAVAPSAFPAGMGVRDARMAAALMSAKQDAGQGAVAPAKPAAPNPAQMRQMAMARRSAAGAGPNRAKGGPVKAKPKAKAKAKMYAKGGSVSSASKRADGCATKGKTRGKFV